MGSNHSSQFFTIPEKYSIYGSPHGAEKWLFIVITNIISIVGCLGYFLVFKVVVPNKSTTFSNGFYTLALSLAIPDILILILQMFYGTAVALVSEASMPRAVMYICGFLGEVGFWTLLGHIVLICINRFSAVVWAKDYHKWFNSRRLWLMIAVCYTLGFGMPTLMYSCSCVYHIASGYGWEFTCNRNGTCADFAMQLNGTLCFTLEILTWILYGLVLVHARTVGKKVSENIQNRAEQDQKERKMLLQIVLITMTFLLYSLTFWTLIPAVQKLQIEPRIGMFIVNVFLLLQSALSPFLYITFASDLRQAIFRTRKIVQPAVAQPNLTTTVVIPQNSNEETC